MYAVENLRKKWFTGEEHTKIKKYGFEPLLMKKAPFGGFFLMSVLAVLGNVGQIAEIFAAVKAIADHEMIGDGKQ